MNKCIPVADLPVTIQFLYMGLIVKIKKLLMLGHFMFYEIIWNL